VIRVFRHYADGHTEAATAAAVDVELVPGELRWVDLEAPTDEELATVARAHGLHPLAVEDCRSRDHQPKLELYADHAFVICRGIGGPKAHDEYSTAKLASFLSKSWLVTYTSVPLPAVAIVRDLVSQGGRQIFELGCDQVLYALLSRLLDSYFPELDRIADELEELEEGVVDPDVEFSTERLLGLRRELLHLRRHAAPQRELFSHLSRGDMPYVDPNSTPFFRNLHDATFRISETIDNLRELASGIFDGYLSLVANRTNETMRVLTVITSIFIPLTFVVGVYGMNFKFMPELDWHYGYTAVWVAMIVIAIGMIWLFKRKKWL
jgi:magnesium transporter